MFADEARFGRSRGPGCAPGTSLIVRTTLEVGRVLRVGSFWSVCVNVLGDRMEALRRDQNALRERMAALLPDLPKTGSAS